MVITMLVSVAGLLVVAVGMLLIMSKRQKALPRSFDPPVVRRHSDRTVRVHGEDD